MYWITTMRREGLETLCTVFWHCSYAMRLQLSHDFKEFSVDMRAWWDFDFASLMGQHMIPWLVEVTHKLGPRDESNNYISQSQKIVQTLSSCGGDAKHPALRIRRLPLSAVLLSSQMSTFTNT
jgi:hypothetical protein